MRSSDEIMMCSSEVIVVLKYARVLAELQAASGFTPSAGLNLKGSRLLQLG